MRWHSSRVSPGTLDVITFATLQEGGGRKGLPKSFLNRFTRVQVELLQREDLLFIAGELPALRLHCCGSLSLGLAVLPTV